MTILMKPLMLGYALYSSKIMINVATVKTAPVHTGGMLNAPSNAAHMVLL